MLGYLAATLVIVGLSALPTWGGQKGQPVPTGRQLIVVVCDGLTWSELKQLGEPVGRLLKKGAIGLLSGTSLELAGRKGVYVTLGSGKRASGHERALLGKWLRRHGKNFRLEGNGNLKAMVGNERIRHDRLSSPNILFVSVPPFRLSSTLKRLLASLPDEGCLWLVVPNSPQTDWLHRRLTPLILFGRSVPCGLLTSATTRRVGLVSSVDFAPTLLSQLGVKVPTEMTGRQMRIVAEGWQDEKARLAYLRWLDERSVRPLSTFPSLVLLIVEVIVLALLLTVADLLSGGRLFVRGRETTTFVLVSGLCFPAALFFEPQLPVPSEFLSPLLVLAILCLLGATALKVATLLSQRLDSPFPPSLLAAGLVSGLTALVALLGVPLYWATLLGHYPTTGWRYFGITNAGIGLTLAGTVFAWRLLSLPKSAMAIWCVSAPLLMGFSLWGANFGGALTLSVGLAVAWEWLTRPHPSWRRALMLGVGALGVTTVSLLALEALLPSDAQAHLGQLLQRVSGQGFAALTEMLSRKLALMGQFFLRTPLNFFVLALFVGFQLSLVPLSKRFPLFAHLHPAFVATFSGAWAGLVLNDSGMEVVGMALVFLGGVFLLALVETRH